MVYLPRDAVKCWDYDRRQYTAAAAAVDAGEILTMTTMEMRHLAAMRQNRASASG